MGLGQRGSRYERENGHKFHSLLRIYLKGITTHNWKISFLNRISQGLQNTLNFTPHAQPWPKHHLYDVFWRYFVSLQFLQALFFSITDLLCIYFLWLLLLCLSVSLFLFLFWRSWLFSNESGKERVWVLMGGKWRVSRRNWGRGISNQNILKTSFNKNKIRQVNVLFILCNIRYFVKYLK